MVSSAIAIEAGIEMLNGGSLMVIREMVLYYLQDDGSVHIPAEKFEEMRKYYNTEQVPEARIMAGFRD